MSGVGRKFPQFSLTGVVSNDVKQAFQPFTHESFAGKWKVFFFWPKDFTFVCPTEMPPWQARQEFRRVTRSARCQHRQRVRASGLARERRS